MAGTPGVRDAPPRFEIETPRSPGAVAVIRVEMPEHDAAGDAWLRQIGFGDIGVGRLVLRRVYEIDDALIARPDPGTLILMPHGGVAVVDAIARCFRELGCVERSSHGDGDSGVSSDARPHRALARAASPLAIDLLLDQPRRWAGRSPGTTGDADLADARVLGRLIEPASVVAVGRPNIGKSSLLNRLAGRSLALAFDRAGTTRDSVGAMIDAAGLVVRWIDTPGLPEPGASGDALADERSVVCDAITRADLLVVCRDAGGAKLRSEDVPGLVDAGVPVLDVVTRSDRSPARDDRAAIVTSAETGEGMGELVAAVREALLPESVYADPRPWKFWD